MTHIYTCRLTFPYTLLNFSVNSILGGLIKINPVYPVNPVKKFIVKIGAAAITLIMQNKPNSQKVKYSVTDLYINIYSILDIWYVRKKQTQNKPKQSQFYDSPPFQGWVAGGRGGC